MKATIREKIISKGRRSLYLDIYPPIVNPKTGKETRREFLNLYIIDKPKNEFDKEHNRETKKLAQAIRAKRQLDMQNGNYGFQNNENKKLDFLEYFKGLAEKRKSSKGNYDNWLSAYNYLEKFTNGFCRFGDINEKFCSDFKDHLLNTLTLKSSMVRLSQNSAHSYFNKFKAAIKTAYEERLYDENPAKWVKAIKQAETQREFLTFEELQTLVKTDFEFPTLKVASIFSALTGLRWSDIQKLTWGEVQYSKAEGYYIRFIQKKTKGVEKLPISEQAFSLLKERKDPEERVFKGLKYSAWHNLKIQQWVMKAGISKPITFHCFRHTFATLQLTLGTDIYTVSKMLGHRELKTTQIYAKVIDAKKIEAANKIQLKL